MFTLRTSGLGQLIVSALALAATSSAPLLAGEIYVPNHAPTTAGPGGYSTLMHPQARSYQLVVGPQELGGMPVGSRITGVTWRLSTWIVHPDWPGVGNTANYANYDIYLSTSNNPPGSLSTTYTDNIGPDVVQVRGGPMSLSDAFFPGGALTPNVNPYGTLVSFTTPYVYQGGDLLLTIRHTGNGFSSGVLDTVSSPHCQAIGVSSYTQPDNWYPQGLITMKLVFEETATYCTAKANSQNGAPLCPNGVLAIGSTGAPSATQPSGFAISAVNALNNKIGILLYKSSIGGSGQGAIPFSGGVLCFSGAPNRTTPVLSGGTPPPTDDCSGVFTIDMNSFAQGGITGPPFPQAYLLVSGQEVCAQFWGRDPGYAPPNNTQLSNGLIWLIGP